MKKSLLALAVLGAFAGAAAAQTNVTLYGIADASIGMQDSDGAAGSANSDSAVTVFSGVQSTSRLGIRGSEDLGGGLKATFNIEAAVNFDNGASDPDLNANNFFWQRRAVVGLAGSWGEVRLGRDYTPGFTAGGVGDVMGYGLFGNWLTFTAQGPFAAGTPAYGGITTRASNGLHYTGSFGGVTIRAMYATGEDYTGNNVGDMYGLSGVYAAGPLSVAAYWQQADLGTAGDRQQYGVGGQYNFGAFRIGLNYGAAEADNLPDHTGWAIGAGMKVGSGEILAQYIQQELDVAGTNPEAKSIGVAYVHPLSKRTNLYATYGQLDNKNGANLGLRYAQSVVPAAGANADPKAFAVGIRHMF